ncbi:MAG TPA: MMPL family transporter [Gaiellaceae bacterium]|nr:MMPL family transporter [Gaiellaceae bacterium]
MGRPGAEPAAQASRWPRLLIRLRFAIVAAWLAGAAAALVYLPSLAGAGSTSLGGLVAADAEAVEAELRSLEAFPFPLLSRTFVVQRDAGGLSTGEQARIAERALRINERRDPLLATVVFALPVTNAAGFFPGSRERGTTALTYLFYRPDASLYARRALARTYAERIERAGDPVTGVTGAVPARLAQWEAIEDALPLVEVATVAFILVLLAFTFRTPVVPVVVLAAAGLTYVLASRSVAALGDVAGSTVPREVEPVLVVLLLGVVTDYSIFFVTSFRRRLEEGYDSRAAAEASVRLNGHVVAVAGLIVALGAAALVVGRLEFFRTLGPAAGLTVLIALAVSLTFVPAVLAIGGSALFWPWRYRPGAERRRRGLPRLTTNRVVAGLVAAVVIAGLVAATAPALDQRLGFTLVRGLPDTSETERAYRTAARGFAPGVLSPLLVLVEGRGLDERRGALVDLQRRLAEQPGIAGVVGPRQLPSQVGLDAFVAPNGAAARFVVILENEPLSAPALDDLEALQRAAPRLLDEVGLGDASVAFAGDTALAAETVSRIQGDTGRIAAAALLVNFGLLALFLRALVAPLYLLVSSALALGAALGLTSLFFGTGLDKVDVTYYVPFTAAVLLLSLGSDYNVFVVGRIWQSARDRPIRAAVAVAVPAASRAVSIAAVALAGSFAMLAFVPLQPFRELAFVMAVGILLDAFVVRSLLVPALVLLVGERSWWPSRRAPAVD